MEAICSSEMSVATQQTARRHIPEDDTLHNHRCGNSNPTSSYMFSFLSCGCLKARPLFLVGPVLLLHYFSCRYTRILNEFGSELRINIVYGTCCHLSYLH
jgi:hypothetical protein